MKVKVVKEVEVKTLQVVANVRYWEDAKINGVSDEEGSQVPCKDSESWKPEIDLATGKILNWEKGKTASIHFKVCDEGSFYLKDENGNIEAQIENDYVPEMLCPKENGYGDYIIMDIDENGFIQNWEVDLSDFEKLDE